MGLYTLNPDELPVDSSKWSQKEKDQYRFGGFKYSFRGPEYIRETIPQIKGLYAFPASDQSTPPDESTDITNSST